MNTAFMKMFLAMIGVCFANVAFGMNRLWTGGLKSDGIAWWVNDDGHSLEGGRYYTVYKGDDRDSITGYNDFSGAFTIPSYVYGYEGKDTNGDEIWRGYVITAVSWNSVGDKPFEYLTSAVVSEGINTLIGAFNGASMITNVTLPSTLRKISRCAFCGCSSLKTLDIPDGVTEIGESAFADCSGLETLVLPSSLQFIGDNAFKGCTSLRSIIIPPGCKAIGSDAFLGCAALASVSLGNCEEIGNRAFKNCSALHDLIVPSTLTNIPQSAFYNCTGLQSVLFTNTLRRIDTDSFRGCGNIKELILPEGLEYVGAHAFDGCSGVERLHIPSTVTNCGLYAFDEVAPCDLSEATFWTMTETRVTNLVFLSGSTSFKCSSKMKDKLQRVELGSSVATLSASAFYSFTNLSEIICHGDIAQVGDSAFYGCTKLTEFPLLNAGVTNWGDSVYCGCTGVEKLIVPSSMKSIPDSMFKNCTGLRELVIEEGVETIAGRAFMGDVNLESIYVGSTVTNLKFSSYSGPNATKVVSATFCQLHPPKYIAKAFLQKFMGVAYYPPTYADEWASALNDAGIGTHKAWTAISEDDPGFVCIEGVDVEYTWLSRYGLLSDASPADMVRAKTKKKDVNGSELCVWHDYVSGTDPTNENDVFTASVTMIDGMFSITWDPDLKDERTYKIWGSSNLVNGGDWEWPTNALHRFFKVTVEMP